MIKTKKAEKKQTLTLMVVALGFVSALVWKDAITAWFKPLFAEGASPWGLTLAALIVTAVVVAITMLLGKFLGEKEDSISK